MVSVSSHKFLAQHRLSFSVTQLVKANYEACITSIKGKTITIDKGDTPNDLAQIINSK